MPKKAKKQPDPLQTTKKPRVVWHPRGYLIAYAAVLEGAKMRDIAKRMGISTGRLRFWASKLPLLQEILDKKWVIIDEPKKNPEFVYVYQRLPRHLKDYWNELRRLDSAAEEAPQEEISEVTERISDTTEREKARRHIYLHAVVKSRFNPSAACRIAGVTYATVKEWSKEPLFSALLDEIEWHKKNYVESSLMSLVAAGDPAATIHANKTLNRDRGYHEKTEIHVTGTVNHEHNLNMIDVTQLDLPLEVRRVVLAAIERLEAKQTAEQENALLPAHRLLETTAIPVESF